MKSPFCSLIILSLLASNLAFAQSPSANPPLAEHGVTLSTKQLLRVQRVSSVFENGTTEFQYDYIEDIVDGAGVTAGRVGFNNSGLQGLIKAYVEKRPNSPLRAYISCLNLIVDTRSPEDYGCLFPSIGPRVLKTKKFKEKTIRLVDFGKFFVAAAKDPEMRKLQDEVVRQNIIEFAFTWADKLKLKTPIGYLVIFDSLLQLGEDGPNGVNAVLKLAPARDSLDEIAWLKKFLLARKDVQQHPYYPDRVTRYTVAPYECYERSDSLIEIIDAGNFDLKKPVKFDYFGDTYQF